MTNLVITAALVSIAITAVLTFVLWRMNQPMLERNKRDGGDGGGSDGGAVPYSHSDRHDADHGSDGGGSDGGGGDGGGD